MKFTRPVLTLFGFCLLLIAEMPFPVRADNLWDGGGGQPFLWGNNANWGGNTPPGVGDLSFSSGPGTTNIVDAPISITGLYFSGTETWTLNTNAGELLSLVDNGGSTARIQNNSSGVVSLNVPLRLEDDTIWSVNGGDLRINGAIGDDGFFRPLTKDGAGTMVLSGVNTYGGSTIVEDGALQLVGGNERLPAETSYFVLGSADTNTSGKLILGGSGGPITQTLPALITLGTGTANAVVGGSSAVSTLVMNIAGNGSDTYRGMLGGTGPNENNLALTINGSAGSIFQLEGANTYTGPTTITAGTLLMGAPNVLPDNSNVVLGGGKLGTGGFSDTAGNMALLSSSIIDMGSGTSVLTFGNLGSGGWSGVLSVWNWSGNGAGGGTDQLLFSASSLSAGQLASIQFYSDAGTVPVGSGAGFAGNELVPVPEPAAIVAALLLMGVIGWRERRTWLHYRPAA